MNLSLGVDKSEYHAFSTSESCFTLIAFNFSVLVPLLFPAAAANTKLAHSQSLSTTNAALAIPIAVKCSRLESEVIASFTISEAFLLHDVSSIHCCAFRLNIKVKVKIDVSNVFFIIIVCFLS